METRGRSQDGNEDGSGGRNERSFRDENGNEDGNGDRNEDEIGEGGEKVKKHKKPHKNCRRDQALLFRTRHRLGRQRVALVDTRQLHSQGLVLVHAHRTEGVTGSERQGGSNGVGIGVGGGNGDGNGVGGRGREWSGNGNGNGKGGGGERRSARWDRGREWRRERGRGGDGDGMGMKTPGRTQDGNGDWSGDGNESNNSGDGNGDRNGNGNGNGNEDRIGEDGGDSKNTRNRTRLVDAMWETGETWVEREKIRRKERLVQ